MNQFDTSSYYENSPFAQKLVIAILCLGSFLGPLMIASVHVALPNIAEDLGASARLLSWVPSAYVITSAVCLLPVGKLGDRVGRKKIYQLGIMIMFLGCIIAALSINMTWLLLARVIQGVGSAMVFGTGMAIVTSVVSSKNRGTALGILSSCVFISLTVSPYLGGVMTETFGWRSVFIMPLPITLAALIISLIFIKGEWKNTSKTLFDFKGTIIFSIIVISTIYGLSHLPNTEGIISLLIAAILIILFIKHQSKIDYGIVNVRLLRTNLTLSFALLSSFFMYASNFGVNFLLSLYLQYIGALSPREAGAMLIYQAMMMAVSSVLAGKISDHFGNRYISGLGCLITTTGYSWLAFSVGFNTPLGHIIIGQILIGFGFGFFSAPNNSAALGSVDNNSLGSASAMVNFVRNAGNLMGMGLVMMLISLFFGEAQITRENYDLLLTAIKIIMTITVAYSLIGATFSFMRARVVSKDTNRLSGNKF